MEIGLTGENGATVQYHAVEANRHVIGIVTILLRLTGEESALVSARKHALATSYCAPVRI